MTYQNTIIVSKIMKENYLIARVIAQLTLLYCTYFCKKSEVAFEKIIKFLIVFVKQQCFILATDKDSPRKGYYPNIFYYYFIT